MSFEQICAKYIEIINKQIELFLDKEESKIKLKEPFIKECYSMIKGYTLMGGKRLRPLAMILAYLASGGKDEKKVLLPAVAIELHQTYSLILDDMMDEDEFRRGSPGVNIKLKEYYLSNFKEQEYNGLLFNRKSSKFTISYAVMLANLTNILSKKAMLYLDFKHETKLRALKIIENVDQKIYHGQMIDVLLESRENISEERYIEMIQLKTAVFFGMALEVGALLAGAEEDKMKQFREFGILSAISFQIQDDLIDLFGDKGHEIGSDIKKKKKTLLMIKAFENANKEQEKILNKIYGNPEATKEDIKKAADILQKTGAVEYCKKQALKFNQNAKELLDEIAVGKEYKELLSEMADFMIRRNF